MLLDSKLSWSAGSGAISHDVYFGISREDVAAGAASTFKGKQAGATFDPGALTGDTTYYWRIDEIKMDGSKVAALMPVSRIQGNYRRQRRGPAPP